MRYYSIPPNSLLPGMRFGAQLQPVSGRCTGSRVTLVEPSTGPLEREVEAMRQEKAAYLAIPPELMAHYAGQYVAIYGGQLIDHDQDEIALLRRLEARYRHDVVLMKKVRPLPEPQLRHRLLRPVRND